MPIAPVTADAIAVQLTSLFMLMNAFLLLPFLARKWSWKRGWIPLSPWIFLLASAVILSLVAGFVAVSGMSNALLGLALGVGTGLSLFHPMAAVSFFVTNLLMRPWELLPYNPALGVIPRFMAGVTMCVWAFDRIRTRRAAFVWGFGPSVFTVLLLWIATCTLISPTMAEDLPVLFKTFLPIYVLSLLIINSVTDREDLRLLKDTITIAISGVIATAIYLTAADPRFLTEGLRLQGAGLLGNSNDLAALVALAAPIPALALLRSERRFRDRLMDLSLLGILMLGLMLSQSRGAIVSLGAAGATYVLIMSRSIPRTLMQGAIVAPVPLLFMLAIDRDSGDLQASSNSRLNYMVTGARMVLDHPIFGVGMNNYPRLYERYTTVFQEWGERTAHSTWVLFMSETGFVGLAIFCLLYFGTLRAVWPLRKEAPEYVLAMVSYGVAMSFLSHSYTLFPYLMVFTVIAATRAHRAGDALQGAP